MHRYRTSPRVGSVAGREPRQVVAILGIVLAGITAAFALPLWMAALCMLMGLGAISMIARSEPVLDPVVIRRDERR